MLHTGLRAEFGREFSNWDLVVMLLQEREMEEEGRLQEERMSYWLMEDWRVFQHEKEELEGGKKKPVRWR